MKTNLKPEIKIEYRTDGDMLYIALSNSGVSIESEEVAPGIVVDVCEHGDVIGIEVEDASKLISTLGVLILLMQETRLRVLRVTIQQLRDIWDALCTSSDPEASDLSDLSDIEKLVERLARKAQIENP